ARGARRNASAGRYAGAGYVTRARAAPLRPAVAADCSRGPRSPAWYATARRQRLTIMTPMSGALDWLAVGDVAEERAAASGPGILGGGGAGVTGQAGGGGAGAAR